MDNNDKLKYIISSRILYESFYYLNINPEKEDLIDISGIRFDNLLTMERIEKIKMDKKELCYAQSNLESTFYILLQMEEYGCILTGVFHIHPGKGPGSIFPSIIDISDQKKREIAGYLAIGGIFSRDGFLRFYSHNIPFMIYVIGRGIKKVEDNLYYLEKTKNQNI